MKREDTMTAEMIATSLAWMGVGTVIGSAFRAPTLSDTFTRIGFGMLLFSIVLMLRSQSHGGAWQ
jgi:hypothetical protein